MKRFKALKTTLAVAAALLMGVMTASATNTSTESGIGTLGFTEQSAPATSASGKAVLYADSGTHTLQVSENGGSFAALGGGGGGFTSTSLPVVPDHELEPVFNCTPGTLM